MNDSDEQSSFVERRAGSPSRLAGSAALWAVAALLVSTVPGICQEPPPEGSPPSETEEKPPEKPPEEPSTLDDTLEAGEGEAVPLRQLVKWNHYEGKYFSIRLGAGFLYEYGAFSQDEDSKAQHSLNPETKVRDSRLLLNGRLKFKRPTTWTAGLMYDGEAGEWFMRQTGIQVEVPEISGQIFIGRAKEGFSLNKVMNGYAGWTMERATNTDLIPILADGIKWLGYSPKLRLIWNLGVFGDYFSEGESFSTYDNQVVGRFAWVPLMSEKEGRVLHIGLNTRYGKVNEGMLQVRARPEISEAPFFVDTGKFAADSTNMLGIEAYYRPGPLLIGMEYLVQDVDAPASGDPVFHGGEVAVSWLATGETRAYNTKGGFFAPVSPARSVFGGGPGAVELVGRFSYIDLDSGPLRGGKLWRITPMVNWHLSNNMRLEFAYGYGSLDRFDLVGETHFFQSRIQLQF